MVLDVLSIEAYTDHSLNGASGKSFRFPSTTPGCTSRPTYRCHQIPGTPTGVRIPEASACRVPAGAWLLACTLCQSADRHQVRLRLCHPYGISPRGEPPGQDEPEGTCQHDSMANMDFREIRRDLGNSLGPRPHRHGHDPRPRLSRPRWPLSSRTGGPRGDAGTEEVDAGTHARASRWSQGQLTIWGRENDRPVQLLSVPLLLPSWSASRRRQRS